LCCGACTGDAERQAQVKAAEETTALGHAMLARLRELPWRRIDVCFKGTTMPFFAHNLIQVCLKWLSTPCLGLERFSRRGGSLAKPRCSIGGDMIAPHIAHALSM
jgi:hypothetical protein